MNKRTSILILLFCILFLVGCQKSIQHYKKAVEEILLPSKFMAFDEKCLLLGEQIDAYLAEGSETEIQPIVEEMEILLDQFTQLQADLDRLPVTDPYISDLHHLASLAVLSYQELLNESDEFVQTLSILSQMEADIETVHSDLMNLILSGTPTTLEYNQALTDFTTVHEEELKLFDLEVATSYLSSKTIKVAKLKEALGTADQTIKEMETIQTYSETDVQVNGLLVQLYERIYEMYQTIIAHQEIIELTNGYEDFSEYLQGPLNKASLEVLAWEKAVGIVN
ncbi:MAG: hypothetical protein H7X94_11390 [Vallitaleaceae bacterium]|nr:hypothetical protein [Vallitaleaceae bacterium]